MVADARIMATWDRASAPISRYFDLIESLATGDDERDIVRGFRTVDKDLASIGIRSENPGLYRPSRPVSVWLISAMLDELAPRIAIAIDRLGEALNNMGDRFEELNARSARFAKVSS